MIKFTANIEVERSEDLTSRHGEHEGIELPMLSYVKGNGKLIGFVLQQFNGNYICKPAEDQWFSSTIHSLYQEAEDKLLLVACRNASMEHYDCMED